MKTTHCARSTVEVLVATPDRKIRSPVVETQRHIADRVREIPANRASLVPRQRGDTFNIEKLTAVVLHAGQHDERR